MPKDPNQIQGPSRLYQKVREEEMRRIKIAKNPADGIHLKLRGERKCTR